MNKKETIIIITLSVLLIGVLCYFLVLPTYNNFIAKQVVLNMATEQTRANILYYVNQSNQLNVISIDALCRG